METIKLRFRCGECGESYPHTNGWELNERMVCTNCCIKNHGLIIKDIEFSAELAVSASDSTFWGHVQFNPSNMNDKASNE